MAPILPQNLLRLLSKSAIRPNKIAAVQATIAKFIADGKDKFQVIADFDHTMSKYADEDGGRCWMVHEILEHEVRKDSTAASLLDETIGKNEAAVGHNGSCLGKISAAELEQMRQRWWSDAFAHLLHSAPFTRSGIDKLVEASRVQLRSECRETFHLSRSANIPFFIASAGIGDLIQRHMQIREGINVQEQRIASNWMVYNDQGGVVRFAEPMIHCWNKCGAILPPEAKYRPNVLICGDSLGDLSMAQGLRPDLQQLSLGFLNYGDDAKRESFLDGYDVVLRAEDGWLLHKSIVQAIITS